MKANGMGTLEHVKRVESMGVEHGAREKEYRGEEEVKNSIKSK